MRDLSRYTYVKEVILWDGDWLLTRELVNEFEFSRLPYIIRHDHDPKEGDLEGLIPPAYPEMDYCYSCKQKAPARLLALRDWANM